MCVCVCVSTHTHVCVCTCVCTWQRQHSTCTVSNMQAYLTYICHWTSIASVTLRPKPGGPQSGAIAETERRTGGARGTARTTCLDLVGVAARLKRTGAARLKRKPLGTMLCQQARRRHTGGMAKAGRRRARQTSRSTDMMYRGTARRAWLSPGVQRLTAETPGPRRPPHAATRTRTHPWRAADPLFVVGGMRRRTGGAQGAGPSRSTRQSCGI
jgi:hypothetical protein